MTKIQQEIYEGLSRLSAEAAAFYLDAVMIMGSDCLLESKMNLVANLSREIDDGFRAIVAHRSPEEIREGSKSCGALYE